MPFYYLDIPIYIRFAKHKILLMKLKECMIAMELSIVQIQSKYLKKNLKIIQGDIRDVNRVNESVEGSDIVFHLSSLITIPYSYHAYQSYIDTNISGLSHLLTACKRYQVEKIVHTSTSEVYGSALYTPIDEKHPLQGQSPYSATKIAADFIAESFYRSFDLPIVTARPFNTYGPRQSLRAVIPSIIMQLITRENGEILDIGDTSPLRDFNYVSDTVAGFISLAESENVNGKVYNIGSGCEVSINSVIEKLFDISSISKAKSFGSITKRFGCHFLSSKIEH